MDRILLLFRKKDPKFYSIEKIFGAIAPSLETTYKVTAHRLSRFSNGLWSIFRNIAEVYRLNADVVHVTGDVHYAILGCGSKRAILTIHDCNFLKNNAGFKRWVLKKLYLELPAQRADIVTTISPKSCAEIAAALNWDKNKIRVIPNPVPPEFRFVDKPFDKADPVVLFIGTTPNKNLERSILALRGLNIRLYILGSPSLTQQQLMQEHHIRFTSYEGLTDLQVAELYQTADLVLYPSLYEGFGMPVIEAQRSGRILVTSNIEPMVSVSGGGAFFVDPYHPDSIRKGVLNAIGDEEQRKAHISKGFENVKQYSLETIAAQYLALYVEVLEK